MCSSQWCIRDFVLNAMQDSSCVTMFRQPLLPYSLAASPSVSISIQSEIGTAANPSTRSRTSWGMSPKQTAPGDGVFDDDPAAGSLDDPAAGSLDDPAAVSLDDSSQDKPP